MKKNIVLYTSGNTPPKDIPLKVVGGPDIGKSQGSNDKVKVNLDTNTPSSSSKKNR